MGVKYQSRDILEEIEFVEHHLHRINRTFGISSDQSGNNWATEDRLIPFVAISGNGDYGSDDNDEAKVIGSEDTPVIAGQIKFDPGFILITDVSDDDEYIIRLIWGTGTINDAITAGQYSTIPFKHDSINTAIDTAHTLVSIGNIKLDIGTKIWIQLKSNTNNATISFYINMHGYNN